MKNWMVVAVVLLASAAFAQTDTVRLIPLEHQDAAEAKVLSERIERLEYQLSTAKEGMASFTKRMTEKYITVEQSDTDHSGQSVGRKGDPSWGVLTAQGFTTFGSAIIAGNSSFSNVNEAEIKKEAELQKKYDQEHPYLYRRKQFENGFRFSEDYRFILPAPEPKTYSVPSGMSCGGVFTANP